MHNQIERGSQHQSEPVAPAKLNALKWLQTSQAYLDHRVAEYRQLGNTAAADSLEESQQHTLDFLREGVSEGNTDFVDFLSHMEEEASDGKPYDSPSYVIAHGMQLDSLALAAERAQSFHDDKSSH